MLKAAGLEYEVRGDGEAVLLIHGGFIADAFLPLMHARVLSERHTLLRYRRRGFVGSDPVPGVFGFEQQARDALALVTHLGVDRTHVVGQGYGGVVAVQLAIEAPQLVQSLVVQEPAIMTAETAAAFFPPNAPLFAAYAAGDIPRALDLFMAAVGAPGWRSSMERIVPGGAEQAERDASTTFDVEMPALQGWVLDAERAGRISQPVLYLSGGASPPLFEDAKQHFQSLIPQTEVVEVPGANHLMQMIDPALVVAPIADFLSAHPF